MLRQKKNLLVHRSVGVRPLKKDVFPFGQNQNSTHGKFRSKLRVGNLSPFTSHLSPLRTYLSQFPVKGGGGCGSIWSVPFPDYLLSFTHPPLSPCSTLLLILFGFFMFSERISDYQIIYSVKRYAMGLSYSQKNLMNNNFFKRYFCFCGLEQSRRDLQCNRRGFLLTIHN